MGPLGLHLFIVAALVIPGVALFTMEMLSPTNNEWLMRRFFLTELFSLAFFGYSLGSTIIVISVGLFLQSRKRAFTKKAVILSHVILIGLLWSFFQLGFHDLLEDAWKKSIDRRNLNSRTAQSEQTEKNSTFGRSNETK